MPLDDRLPFHRGNLPEGAGGRLMEHRKAAERSRRDVAAAAGIGPRTLARIERVDQIPRWPTVVRLCEALGIDAHTIAPRWSKDSDDVPTDPRAAPGVGLRALRVTKGVSMAELSRASGVSIATFSRYERGLLVSYRLGGREKAAVRSEGTPVLANDRVADALGYPDSQALREACLKAGLAVVNETGEV